MNGRLKILALISLKFAIAVAFLIYLSQSIQWKDLLFQFKAISYSTTLILLVGSLLGCLIEGLRWKLHVADAAFDFKQAVRSVAMGLS